MNMTVSLVDTLPCRVLNHVVAFHLLQPISLSPIAPDENLPTAPQVVSKEIGPYIQKAMPSARPSITGLAVQSRRFARLVIEINLAISSVKFKSLNQAGRRKVEA